MWVARYNGTENMADSATSVAVSPADDTVFVTGWSRPVGGFAWATIAYNATTGAQLWVKAIPAVSTTYFDQLAVSPSGDTVFVTAATPGAASGDDYATVAYSAATGAKQWLKHYNGPGNSTDDPSSVAVSPTGNAVYVTGTSTGATSGIDYATIAYTG